MDWLFETETEYTFEEYRRFCRMVFQRMDGMGKKAALLSAAMLILGITGFFRGDTAFGMVFLLAAPLFLAVLRLRMERTVKKAWETNRVTQGIRTRYRFYEDFYEQENDLGYTKVSYEKLYRILETDQNFYLMYGKNQGAILVKERCSQELMEFLRKKERKEN